MLSVRTYQLLFIALGAILLVSVSGCKVTKNFTEDQTLLKRIKIKVVNEQNIQQRQKASEDLKHVASQQPNKRTFGFLPFKLWLYTAANHGKENKVKWWIKNKVGEAPTIYDADQADKSDDVLSAELRISECTCQPRDQNQEEKNDHHLYCNEGATVEIWRGEICCGAICD